MGTTATEGQTPLSYDNAGGFQNSTPFQYTGTADMSLLTASSGYTGASGGVNVLFPANANPGGNTTFFIADINVLGLSSAGLTFALYIPAGGPTTIANVRNQFRLNLFSSTDATTYTAYQNNAAYTAVGTITAGAWNQFQLNPLTLPSGTGLRYLQLRFIRLSAGDALPYRLDDVVLTGTTTPTINLSPVSLSFGNQTINTASAPQTVDVQAAYLNGPITVTAPSGFLVAPTGSSSFSSSLTLTPTNGMVNTSVDVEFLPTAATNYVGNVSFSSSGATTQNVGVSGTGQTAPTTLTTSTAGPLNFGSVQVGSASASQSFTVNGSNLTSNVTITAPADYQVRIGSGVFGSTATITPTSGTVSNVTVDVRFVPSTTGTISGSVSVASTGATTQFVSVTGNGTAAPAGATVTVSPTTLPFGNVTQSGSASTLTLTVSGTNLTAPITLTPSSSSIQLRNASAGGSFASGVLTITPAGGTVTPVTIEVRLVAPIASGSFNGTIVAASTGATSTTVTVTATSNGNVSDISITNPSNNSFTFATRPATFSVSQSFLVSATNLLQDLTVAPTGVNAAYFQVSKDNVNFFSSITFTRDAQNNVVQQPVYVRFVPGNNAITVNGLIRASSSPAPDRDVSVTGISEPTIRLRQAIGSFGDATVKNTTSSSRTVRLETFLLTGPLTLYFPNDTEDPQRNPTGTPQFEFDIVNGGNPTLQASVPYQYSDTLQNNADGNRIVDLLVRYHPTRVGASTQELTFTNNALNSGQPITLLSGNGRASGFAIAEEPTAQSTAQIIRPTGSTTATITFDLATPPNGTTYGQNRLVIASRTYTLLPTSLFPLDKQNFNPGTTNNGAYQYGTGTTIEASTGTFVVFSGAANSFTVGNLDPGTNYYFFAFEFNDDGLLNAENYKVPSNQPQTPLPVELTSFTARLRNGKVDLNWVTAQEKNNKGFEVERSQNGRSFSSIGFVAGAGNSTSQREYSFVDNNPLGGVSYYRLRQIDTDETSHILPVVSVRNSDKIDASVYPNPVSDVLTVRMAGASVDTKVTVVDMMGRTVMTGKLALDGTFNMGGLKAGNYIVTITDGANTSSHKVVKQ